MLFYLVLSAPSQSPSSSFLLLLPPTSTHPNTYTLSQGTFSLLGAGALTYQDLYKLVAKALFRTHVEGQLKAEIIKAPEKYVQLDPDMAQTLLDQKSSGKQLLLITNSDYEYTSRMMAYSYDRFLPDGMKWRDLFDMVREVWEVWGVGGVGCGVVKGRQEERGGTFFLLKRLPPLSLP